MFKDILKGSHDDFIKYTLDQMDKFHINMAMVGFHESSEVKIKAGKIIRIDSFLTCLLILILKVKLKHQTDA